MESIFFYLCSPKCARDGDGMKRKGVHAGMLEKARVHQLTALQLSQDHIPTLTRG